jgi:hypothetical protein
VEGLSIAANGIASVHGTVPNYAISSPVMICAPAAKRPAGRMGKGGGTAESAARTAQMITPLHPQTWSLCLHSLPAAKPNYDSNLRFDSPRIAFA